MNQLQQDLDRLRAVYIRTEPTILPTLAVPPKLVPDSAVSAGLAPTTSGQGSGKEDRLTTVLQQQPSLLAPDPQVPMPRVNELHAMKRKNSFTDTYPAKKLLDLPLKPQPRESRALLFASTTNNALGTVMNIIDQRVDQMDWQLGSISVLRPEPPQPVYHPQALTTVGASNSPGALGESGQDNYTGQKVDGYCPPPPPEDVGMDIDSYKQKTEEFYTKVAAGLIPAPPDDSDSEFE